MFSHQTLFVAVAHDLLYHDSYSQLRIRYVCSLMVNQERSVQNSCIFSLFLDRGQYGKVIKATHTFFIKHYCVPSPTLVWDLIIYNQTTIDIFDPLALETGLI